MTEDYTPSILIEPPQEQGSAGLLSSSSLGMFDSYCQPSDASLECYPQPPSLFIHPDPLSISTEFDDFLHADNKFGFSPSTSGRSSPVGAWSPASSYAGEIFPEDYTHDDYLAQSLSAHSSPAHSPSSLSPLFDGFALDESYPTSNANVERSVLNGPPAFSRLRSASHSAPSAELWADDGVGRGRSSSFSGASDSAFFSSSAPNAFTDSLSVANVEAALSDSLGTGFSWGAPSPSDTASSDASRGGLVTGWRYPSRDGPAADTHDLSPQPVSPSLLTVPSVSLRRRGACSARRTVSSSDINTLMPPEDQGLGRGRGQHRSTLSFPNSRNTSAHSRSSSCSGASSSEYELGYSSSPAFEDAEAEADCDGPLSIGRRRTFTAMRGPREGLPAMEVPLNRAISAPSTRSRRSVRGTAQQTGLGVFKAAPLADGYSFSDSDGGSARTEFRVAPPAPAPSFKVEVASNKIREASKARRLNPGTFKCPLPTCESTFTARHNLVNHINSHNKHRPHKCPCGMSFTTQGVLNRHKKRCRK